MKNSDVFILIPVTGKYNAKGIQVSKDRSIEDFVNVVSNSMKYACNNNIVNTIKRFNIGEIQLLYYFDDGFTDENSKYVNCSIFITEQAHTNLGIVNIVFKRFFGEDSQLGDIVFTNKIRIKYNENLYNLDEFLALIGYIKNGLYRILYINGSKNSEIIKENKYKLNYLLCGESSIRTHESFDIDPAYNENFVDNLCKHDFCELYATDRAIVMLCEDFKNRFEENNFIESMYYYIIELTILQYSAIYRINDIIIKNLANDGKISSKKLLKLIENFGKTIILWDNKIFSYYFDQYVSDKLIKIFKTNELRDEYEKNSNHLQQMIEIKKGIYSNLEGTILNIIAFVLAILQIAQFILTYENILIGKAVTVSFLTLFSTFLFIFIILYKHNKF